MINHTKNHKLKRELKKLIKIKRHKHHPLLHRIHKKHGISHKTLFYIKEYGAHSHVINVIMKESILILILATLMSAFGGIALEKMKEIFLIIIPFVILYPTLNGMIGSYGSIISSKFGTMLHQGKVKDGWWTNKELRKLYYQLITIALGTGILSSTVAIIIAYFSKYVITSIIILKIYGIVLLDVFILVNILFTISIYAGRYYFKHQEDPNNFLVPLATAIADLGNGLILAGLIFLLF
ncbi:MAG: magnesium transporter [Candidatus Nanoarchaeia archaeon]